MSRGSGKRRWIASERIAARILEDMGYKILEVHKKIKINGVEVGEVDAIALGPDGQTYAVEVKAGRLDVTGIRQAYVNAKLVNAKPLVVAKGFADEAAEKLAEKLGVKVVQLSDVFLVDSEELEEIVFNTVLDVVAETLAILLDDKHIPKPEQVRVLEAIASSTTIEDAARKLRISLDEVAKAVADMTSKGLLPRWASRNWVRLRLVSRILATKVKMMAIMDRLERIAEDIEDAKNTLRRLLG